MLDFKNGFQFLGLLLILLTAFICLNYTCNKCKPEVISNTQFKTDTIIKYVYGTGKAKRVVNKIIRVNDTITLSDTFIIFRDKHIDLEVNNITSDSPSINYRILEKTIKDSIFIKEPVTFKNNFNAGVIATPITFSPSLSYSTQNCNYLIGYDVINKAPSFGIMINLSNIARPKRTGQR
jgi:hypothetical protein